MKRNTRRIIAAGSIAAVAAGSMLFLSSAEAAKSVTPLKQARATVLAAVPGKVLSVKKRTRSGFTAWAITVKRSDGSVVVGYVDVKSGIAFDWTVKAGPGEPTIDLDGSDSVLEPAEPPEPVPSPTPSETSAPSASPTAESGAAPAAAPAPAPVARPTAETEKRPSRSASPTASPTTSARVPGGGRGDGFEYARPPRDGGRQSPPTPGATAPAPTTSAPATPAPPTPEPSTPEPTPAPTAPAPAAPAAAAPVPAPQQFQPPRPQGGDGGGRGGGGGRRSFPPPAG